MDEDKQCEECGAWIEDYEWKRHNGHCRNCANAAYGQQYEDDKMMEERGCDD